LAGNPAGPHTPEYGRLYARIAITNVDQMVDTSAACAVIQYPRHAPGVCITNAAVHQPASAISPPNGVYDKRYYPLMEGASAIKELR